MGRRKARERESSSLFPSHHPLLPRARYAKTTGDESAFVLFELIFGNLFIFLSVRRL